MLNTHIKPYAPIIGALLGSAIAVGFFVIMNPKEPYIPNDIVIMHESAPLHDGIQSDIPPAISVPIEIEHEPEYDQKENKDEDSIPRSPSVREALRLQKRLVADEKIIPSLSALVQAIDERHPLLSGSLIVNFETPDGTPLKPWIISLKTRQHWLSLKTNQASAKFIVDPIRIRSAIARDGYPSELSPPVHSAILDVSEDTYGVIRAQTSRLSRPGYIFNAGEVAPIIASAFEKHVSSITIPVTYDPGRVFFASSSGIITMDLLATGRSDFSGSVPNRSFNIKKALNEKLNNILISPGQSFSFNDAIGSVAERDGWLEALGIFNGTDLQPTQGGGICQTSTTLYRAILNAGLPIEKQYNHSLYVSYYEKYGVGLDATIYLGGKDLIFTNDTSSWILVQAYPEGNEAFIHIYGVPDGRTVDLEGPFMTTNVPDDFDVNGRDLRSNQIAWKYSVTYPDGTEQKTTLVSTYKKGIPIKILRKYAVAQGE